MPTVSFAERQRQLNTFTDLFVQEFMAEVRYLEELSRGNVPERKAVSMTTLLNVACALVSFIPIPGGAAAVLVSHQLIVEGIKLAQGLQTLAVQSEWLGHAQEAVALAGANLRTYFGREESRTASESESKEPGSDIDERLRQQRLKIAVRQLKDEAHEERTESIDLTAFAVLARYLAIQIARRYEQAITERLSVEPAKALMGLARVGARRALAHLSSHTFLAQDPKSRVSDLLSGVALGQTIRWYQRPLQLFHRNERLSAQAPYAKKTFTAEALYTQGVWVAETPVLQCKVLSNAPFLGAEFEGVPHYGYVFGDVTSTTFPIKPYVGATPDLAEWRTRRIHHPIPREQLVAYLSSVEVLAAQREGRCAKSSLHQFLHQQFPSEFPVYGRAVLQGDLTELNFASGNYEGVDFSGSQLSGNLSHTSFAHAALYGARFVNVTANAPVNFAGAALGFADLSRARLMGEVNLTGADLTCATLTDAQFGSVEQAGTCWYKAQLEGVSYDGILKAQKDQLLALQANQTLQRQQYDEMNHKLDALGQSMQPVFAQLAALEAREKATQDALQEASAATGRALSALEGEFHKHRETLAELVNTQADHLAFESYVKHQLKTLGHASGDQTRAIEILTAQLQKVQKEQVDGEHILREQTIATVARFTQLESSVSELTQMVEETRTEGRSTRRRMSRLEEAVHFGRGLQLAQLDKNAHNPIETQPDPQLPFLLELIERLAMEAMKANALVVESKKATQHVNEIIAKIKREQAVIIAKIGELEQKMAQEKALSNAELDDLVNCRERNQGLQQVLKRHSSTWIRSVLTLGIVSAISNGGSSDLEFLNFKMQECYAAKHIVRLCRETNLEIQAWIQKNKDLPRYEMMFQIVASLMREENDETLRYFGDLKVIARGNVVEMGVETDHQNPVAAITQIPSELVASLRNGNVAMRAKAVKTLVTLTENADNQLLIAQTPKLLECLIELLHNAHSKVRYRVARALGNLVLHAENKVTIAGTPGLRLGLVGLLLDAHSDLRESAARILANLVLNAEDLVAIARIPKALQGLVDLLQNVNSETRKSAVGALRNLSLWYEFYLMPEKPVFREMLALRLYIEGGENIQYAVRSPDGTREFKGVISFKDIGESRLIFSSFNTHDSLDNLSVSRILEQSSIKGHTLAWHDAENQEAIATIPGALLCLVGLLQDADSEIRRLAVGVLWNLSKRKRKDIARIPEVFERLVGLLQDRDSGIRESAARVLGYFVWYAADVIAGIPGILLTLIQLLQDDHPGVSRQSQRIIWGLKEPPEARNQLLRAVNPELISILLKLLDDDGHISTVTGLLRIFIDRHAESKALVEQALRVRIALLWSDSAQERENALNFLFPIFHYCGSGQKYRLTDDVEALTLRLMVLLKSKEGDVRTKVYTVMQRLAETSENQRPMGQTAGLIPHLVARLSHFSVDQAEWKVGIILDQLAHCSENKNLIIQALISPVGWVSQLSSNRRKIRRKSARVLSNVFDFFGFLEIKSLIAGIDDVTGKLLKLLDDSDRGVVEEAREALLLLSATVGCNLKIISEFPADVTTLPEGYIVLTSAHTPPTLYYLFCGVLKQVKINDMPSLRSTLEECSSTCKPDGSIWLNWFQILTGATGNRDHTPRSKICDDIVAYSEAEHVIARLVTFDCCNSAFFHHSIGFLMKLLSNPDGPPLILSVLKAPAGLNALLSDKGTVGIERASVLIEWLAKCCDLECPAQKCFFGELVEMSVLRLSCLLWDADSNVQKHAANALCHLARNEATRRQIGQMPDLITRVMDFLKETNWEGIENGVRLFAILIDDHDNRQRIIDRERVVIQLADLLNTQGEKVQEYATDALAHLAKDGPENQRFIVQVPGLLDHLGQFLQIDTLSKSAVNALLQLAKDNPENQRLIAQTAEVLPQLMALLKGDEEGVESDTVKKLLETLMPCRETSVLIVEGLFDQLTEVRVNTTNFLIHLTHYFPEASRLFGQESKIISRLGFLLSDLDWRVRALAALALMNLAENAENQIAIARIPEALEQLVGLLQDANSDVRWRAAGALCNLAENAENRARLIQTVPLIDRLVELLEDDASSINGSSAYLLICFARDPQGLELIGQDVNVLPRVVALLREDFEEDAGFVHGNAMCLLYHLAHHSQTRERISAIPDITLLLQGLLGEEGLIARVYAAALLLNLRECSDGALIAPNALEMLTSALTEVVSQLYSEERNTATEANEVLTDLSHNPLIAKMIDGEKARWMEKGSSDSEMASGVEEKSTGLVVAPRETSSPSTLVTPVRLALERETAEDRVDESTC